MMPCIRLSALPAALQELRELCLSLLFRCTYLARDLKQFYCITVRSDWHVPYKLSYARKALRLRMGRRYA